MATTVRSIGAMPFQGGQFTGGYSAHSMVRLTNSRAVWTYYQTGPNWLAASVIDVPGGFAAGGTPTLTNQQLLIPMTQVGVTSCARINQTTFVMITGNPGGSVFYTGNPSWQVFEVDTGGVFTRVDSGTFNFGSTQTGTAYHSFAASNFKMVELKDNLVMYTAMGMMPNNGLNLYGLKGSYDTSAKKMTWDTTPTNLLTARNSNIYEIISRPIPGRDMTMVQVRYTTPTPVAMAGASGVVINNQTGAVVTVQAKLPQDTLVGTDMVPLPGDRVAFLTNNYTIQWFSVDYINGSFINLGTSQFTSVLAADSLGHHLLPLTTDYVLRVLRIPMSVAPGQQRFKVIRRVDQNLSEQSPNSASNSNQGFGTNVATTTIAAFNQSYPEFIDGKVIWFGLDSSTAATKFSWTVIGLDPPTQ